MSLVIGLHGAKGSGKDDFFNIVKKAFPNLDIRKVAFADPIKNQILHIFDIDSEEQYDLFKRTTIEFSLHPDYSPDTVQGRRVVREIGMLMRSYDQDQFTRYVENEIKSAPGAIWCITDLRFDNELELIKNKLNGIVIKIKRQGFEYDGHQTETEFPDEVVSSIIENNGSYKSYELAVIAEMNSILQTLSVN